MVQRGVKQREAAPQSNEASSGLWGKPVLTLSLSDLRREDPHSALFELVLCSYGVSTRLDGTFAFLETSTFITGILYTVPLK